MAPHLTIEHTQHDALPRWSLLPALALVASAAACSGAEASPPIDDSEAPESVEADVVGAHFYDCSARTDWA